MFQVGYGQSSIFEVIIFSLALLFIILPVFVNYIQLHLEIKTWLTDTDSTHTVQPWVHRFLRQLYFLCILTGSAQSTVLVCNSNLFLLKRFNMGLNKRQLAIFKNKRIFGTVLVEVKFTIFI